MIELTGGQLAVFMTMAAIVGASASLLVCGALVVRRLSFVAQGYAKGDWVLANPEDVETIDTSRLENHLEVVVKTRSGETAVYTGIHALEAMMVLCPSALEGKPKIKFPRFMWTVHNLVGHPMMQFFAFFKMYRAAFFFHDATVPAPRRLP